jgi:hypothetical protein
MESITFPRYLYFPRDWLGGSSPAFASATARQAASPQTRAGLKNVISGRENQANTAAKATAREQFMYGYMRSLRK